jgi:hypothetical protein
MPSYILYAYFNLFITHIIACSSHDIVSRDIVTSSYTTSPSNQIVIETELNSFFFSKKNYDSHTEKLCHNKLSCFFWKRRSQAYQVYQTCTKIVNSYKCLWRKMHGAGWNSTCQLLCGLMSWCGTCSWYRIFHKIEKKNNFQPFSIVSTSVNLIFTHIRSELA